MSDPYGIGACVAIFQITDNGLEKLAVVWQASQAYESLLTEFTTRFGSPMGESIGPFDLTSEPEGLVMLYEDGPQ